jgi:hypothetical protein
VKYDRQLTRLAKQLGCPEHGSPLYCEGCAVQEPIPEPLTTRAGDFVNAILARFGRAGIRAAVLRVQPPPHHGTCGRCGGPRRCGTCQERSTKALLHEIELTAEEQATLEAVLADCRAVDQQRATERGH